jgi:hypothetical protein
MLTGKRGNLELLSDNANVMTSNETRRLSQIEETLVRKEAVNYWIN